MEQINGQEPQNQTPLAQPQPQSQQQPEPGNKTGFNQNLKNWVLTPILIIAAVAAFYFFIGHHQVRRPNSPGKGTALTSVPGGGAAPADFQINYKEQLPDLAKIPNYQQVLQKYGLQLSSEQQNYLNQNKFLLLDVGKSNLASDGFRCTDEMLCYFDQLGGSPATVERTPADTVLVTPDIILHAYHKFFDIALKDAEKHQLSADLGQFITALYDNVDAQMQQHQGPAHDHYQKILAQLTVARVIFENQSPPKPDSFDTPEQEDAYIQADQNMDSFANAKKILAKYSKEIGPTLTAAASTELQNIYKASDLTPSPLFADYNDHIDTDYTQYTPRSHYTETSQLRAYFRTMMYFGRSAYFFKTNDGITDAALLNSLFNVNDPNSGVKPFDPWSKITAITNFFAGQNDDLGYPEITDWINKIAPNSQDKIANADPTVAAQLAANIWQLRQPQVLSDAIISDQVPNQNKNDLLRETLSFRIFGQKFTFDAWLYSQLTAGQEQSNPKLPSTPSALFVPAAFGDNNAENYAQRFLKTDFNFTDQQVRDFTAKLQSETDALNKVPAEQWNSSLGTAWLKVLSSMTHTYDQKYPAYMQSKNFSDKQIQTYLGSYTELKHDTLLYAKQSYAELGGGGDDSDNVPPVARGFVEPNMDFWNKLNDLIALTQKMFTDNGLDQSPLMPRLSAFKDQVQFYSNFAKQELQGTKISDEDYENLRTDRLSYMAEALDGAVIQPDQKLSALIADIHTDIVKSQILYEATAKPYLMLTLVGDAGDPRVTAGVVYNHYEFTAPLGGNRLTDEQWRNTVYNNPAALPNNNFWYDSLLVK